MGWGLVIFAVLVYVLVSVSVVRENRKLEQQQLEEQRFNDELTQYLDDLLENFDR